MNDDDALKSLASLFSETVNNQKNAGSSGPLGSAAPADALSAVYAQSPEVKKAAYNSYLRFTGLVAYGVYDGIAGAIRATLKASPLGIAADFNGSARTVSIDNEFLSGLGISFAGINNKAGEIAHRIVPEGESLEPCRQFLEQQHKEDPAFIAGYVPDCDGDRGNLVVWDETEGKARILEAQEVFALACVAELSHLVWTGELKYDNKGNSLQKAAIAVNDPTSLRIDRIAKAFDVSVFRAEVGEANVVGLARRLRENGYIVRILGEGSAGGNIVHPAAVRDPINTIMSILKLLAVRSAGDRKGFFEIWCDLSDQAEIYRADFTLADILASLPCFITTGAYTDEALLRVKTLDQGALRERYQRIFLREWESRRERIKNRCGAVSWEAAAYTGMDERRGITNFGECKKGGFKINFLNDEGSAVASIWMRPSATEPVFRIMADAEGKDPRLERDLIEWQRSMVAEADSESTGEL
jgi:phosphoglucomutase